MLTVRARDIDRRSFVRESALMDWGGGMGHSLDGGVVALQLDGSLRVLREELLAVT